MKATATAMIEFHVICVGLLQSEILSRQRFRLMHLSGHIPCLFTETSVTYT